MQQKTPNNQTNETKRNKRRAKMCKRKININKRAVKLLHGKTMTTTGRKRYNANSFAWQRSNEFVLAALRRIFIHVVALAVALLLFCFVF